MSAAKKKKPAPSQSGEIDLGAAGDKRAQIRLAAFHCFSERGFHDTKVDEICREAGISKGAFYWHFESKEAVFLNILETWADEVEREVMAQFREAFDAKDPVKALLGALSREGRRGRRVLPVWLDGLVQSQKNPMLREAIARFMERVRRSLATVVTPAFSPYYSEEEIQVLAGLLFSCFIGAISQHIADPDKGHYEKQVKALMDTVERFSLLIGRDR